MPLTEKSKETAKYLVDSWNNEVIDSYFELVDATAIGDRTIQTVPVLGILKDNFISPALPELMDLANYAGRDLIYLREGMTSRGGRKWSVQLREDLRDFVNNNFDTIANDAPLNKVPKFFISYSHQDKPFTDRLAKHLRRVYGHDSVWFDEGIYAGQQWWDKIVLELDQREILIYVLSREALESVYCRAEFTEAWRLQKQIIPIKIRDRAYPHDINQTQRISIIGGEITVDSIVEIFAAIVQKPISVSPVAQQGLWATRVLRPVDNRAIEVVVKIPANRDPGNDNETHLCNTGILLIQGDELNISSVGSISVDNNQTWCDSYGVFPNPSDPSSKVVHPLEETYKATGYPKSILDVGEYGVVGSLIGWSANDQSPMKDVFVVGANLSKTVKKAEEGFLHLAVNDSKGMYGDNVGFFTVRIHISHPD